MTSAMLLHGLLWVIGITGLFVGFAMLATVATYWLARVVAWCVTRWEA
jgi:hypothetical protein